MPMADHFGQSAAARGQSVGIREAGLEDPEGDVEMSAREGPVHGAVLVDVGHLRVAQCEAPVPLEEPGLALGGEVLHADTRQWPGRIVTIAPEGLEEHLIDVADIWRCPIAVLRSHTQELGSSWRGVWLMHRFKVMSTFAANLRAFAASVPGPAGGAPNFARDPAGDPAFASILSEGPGDAMMPRGREVPDGRRRREAPGTIALSAQIGRGRLAGIRLGM